MIALVGAEEFIQRDVNVEIILPKTPEPNETYTNIFRITNLDHISGRSDSLDVEVNYNFTYKNTTYNYTFFRTLNSFTQTGMGEITFEEDIDYEICVNVKPLNFIDLNLDNNYKCFNSKEKEEVKTKVSSCECELNISLDYELLKQGKTQGILLDYCTENNQFVKEITYWVEDVYGKITKSKVSTTNPSKKSYTPRFSEEKLLIVKAEVEECNINFEKLFGFYPEKRAPYLNLKIPTSGNFGDIINLEIEGYVDNKEILELGVFDEELIGNTLKFEIQNEFNLKFPFLLEKHPKEGIFTITANSNSFLESERIFLRSDFKEEVKGEITNFFTRAQNFQESINLFFRANTPDNSKVKIYTQKEIIDFKYSSGQIGREINISYFDELIFVKLFYEDVLLDVSYLRLNLTLPENEEVAEEVKKEKQTSTTTSNIERHVITPPDVKESSFNYNYFWLLFIILFFVNYKKLFIFLKNK